MQFMIIRKADEQTEAAVLPREDLLAAMGAFVQELVNAGVLLAGEGLEASVHGTRGRGDSGGPPRGAV